MILLTNNLSTSHLTPFERVSRQSYLLFISASPKGDAVIKLYVGNEPTEKRYVIGISPEVWCCSEKKKYILVFIPESNAKKVKKRLHDYIVVEESTKVLQLCEISFDDQN